MNDEELKRLGPKAWETIKSLREELAKTNSGLMALALELEQRVDERTAELRVRAHQQAVVAILSQQALTVTDLQVLMHEAVSAVARTLAIDYCLIFQLLPDDHLLELKASVGLEAFQPEQPRVVTANSAFASQLLHLRKPMVVANFHTEERFQVPEVLGTQEIVSGMGTLICGKGEPFGILEIYTQEPRKFTEDDIHFLQAVANVLAGACERKQAEDQLKYLSMHDFLTKLYNRAYFEEEMRRIEQGRFRSVGIVVCDVDGLKLINDTLGHDFGDKLLILAAEIIRSSFRSGDLVARIGGDEFVVLLPNTNELAAEAACQRIKDAIVKYNELNSELPLSLSIGYAVSTNGSVHISDLFKEADDKMYREKLLNRHSSRGAIVHTLMKALAERDFITQGHADRMQALVTKMALAINFPKYKIADLQLLAQFHDIGKVGVPDRILFKPGPLTPEEQVEMRRHCEIGYRIAMSATDLAPVAEWILKHHEWWNGKGYPLGIKKEGIPLECRILAIADAYDAMTNFRPYRQKISQEEVLSELRRCAGTQFDPELVPKFEQVLKT